MTALLLALLLCAPPLTPGDVAEPLQTPTLAIEVFFSPGHDCEQAWITEIGRATESIDVAAYQFTSAPIAKALVAAHQRHVRVRVILDAKAAGTKYSVATFLGNAGVAAWLDSHEPIMHDKYGVIDNRVVLMGSYNLTKNATRNAESLVVIRRPEVAEQFAADWEKHRKHSTRGEQ